MQYLKLGFQFRILPFQNAYPLIPGFELAIKGIDDPQVFLIHIGGLSVLLQDPRSG
jgi:hypothetical protein